MGELEESEYCAQHAEGMVSFLPNNHYGDEYGRDGDGDSTLKEW